MNLSADRELRCGCLTGFLLNFTDGAPYKAVIDETKKEERLRGFCHRRTFYPSDRSGQKENYERCVGKGPE